MASTPAPTPAPPSARPPIPSTVWVLGFVSLLMDVSSEMIHALLPLFLVSSLGASALMVGLIDGLGEALALAVRVFSGSISDALRRRKPLALLGYALGAVSKPLFALATGTGLVLFARLSDRLGKGLRGAPRDALIADVTPPQIRGAAFGLRQSLDTIGAFAGPLLAVVLMLLWHDDFRAVFWVAVVPAALAVLLLALGVREPQEGRAAPAAGSAKAVVAQALAQMFSRERLRALGRPFWGVVALGMVFTLARFSEAFLVLRGQQVGIALALAPLVLVAMSAVYALAAYPFGRLADRVAPEWLLAAGLAVLIGADLLLAAGGSVPVVLAGALLWGLHMGMTQGLLAALVARTAPAELRGSAFGWFGLATGVATLAASVVAGALWDTLGARATFVAGALFSAATLAVLAWRAWRRPGG
jgi:MFS family permease